jgi:hypothetical protein
MIHAALLDSSGMYKMSSYTELRSTTEKKTLQIYKSVAVGFGNFCLEWDQLQEIKNDPEYKARAVQLVKSSVEKTEFQLCRIKEILIREESELKTVSMRQIKGILDLVDGVETRETQDVGQLISRVDNAVSQMRQMREVLNDRAV